jgi:hypothetical protein
MQSGKMQPNLCIFLSSSFDKIESDNSTVIPCCKMKRAPASVHCPVIWVCTKSQKFTHKMYFSSPDTAPKLLAIVVPAKAERGLNCQGALEQNLTQVNQRNRWKTNLLAAVRAKGRGCVEISTEIGNNVLRDCLTLQPKRPCIVVHLR